MQQQPGNDSMADAEGARVALRESGSGENAALDGVWWPRSRDLAAELPGLVAALEARGLRVSRVAYSRESWDEVLRRLPVAGRVVLLGWFRTIDPNSVSLTGSDGRLRLDLLLLPHTSQQAMFEQAVAQVLKRDHRDRASATLAAVAANLASSRTDEAAETAWESEGGTGHFSRSRPDGAENP